MLCTTEKRRKMVLVSAAAAAGDDRIEYMHAHACAHLLNSVLHENLIINNEITRATTQSARMSQFFVVVHRRQCVCVNPNAINWQSRHSIVSFRICVRCCARSRCLCSVYTSKRTTSEYNPQSTNMQWIHSLWTHRVSLLVRFQFDSDSHQLSNSYERLE